MLAAHRWTVPWDPSRTQGQEKDCCWGQDWGGEGCAKASAPPRGKWGAGRAWGGGQGGAGVSLSGDTWGDEDEGSLGGGKVMGTRDTAGWSPG